ncbi:cytidine deaminase-like protein [Aureobasidium subglaciale]|nr:cytidine deaminase-like protein [Aureobasidium subglaciale]KAI5273953.1 cytidine deaminase-like protein [Aureobasidium subglaciale]
MSVFPPRPATPTLAQQTNHLEACLSLQTAGVEQHTKRPFAALLVSPTNEILLTHLSISHIEHAESSLALLASKHYSSAYLWTCTLYTTWEPCAMCTGTIYWANIGSVVYAAEEKVLKEITGEGNEENFTMSLGCREVFKHGQKDVKVFGPVMGEDSVHQVPGNVREYLLLCFSKAWRLDAMKEEQLQHLGPRHDFGCGSQRDSSSSQHSRSTQSSQSLCSLNVTGNRPLFQRQSHLQIARCLPKIFAFVSGCLKAFLVVTSRPHLVLQSGQEEEKYKEYRRQIGGRGTLNGQNKAGVKHEIDSRAADSLGRSSVVLSTARSSSHLVRSTLKHVVCCMHFGRGKVEHHVVENMRYSPNSPWMLTPDQFCLLELLGL